MAPIDLADVKLCSEAVVRKHGGLICDWLPFLEPDNPRRTVDAIARRALILNAMLQISFKAPIPVIRGWIHANGLGGDLADSERAILAKNNTALTEREHTSLFWYIEALWALVWVGGLVDDMPLNGAVGKNLASLCPNLQRNESGTGFVESMTLRPHEALYRQLDLYYRAHWWLVQARLTGQKTADVSFDVVMERRKALEWALNDQEDWDSVEMGT